MAPSASGAAPTAPRGLWRYKPIKDFLKGACFGTCPFQIRDGDSATSPPLTSLCGYSIPSTVHSSGGSLYIRFFLGARSYARGYDISYTTSDDAGCGGTLYDTR